MNESGAFAQPQQQVKARAAGVSSFASGPIGLNTVPSARFDETGVVSSGVTFADPYIQAYLGFQIADPLYIGLRQTIQSPIFGGDDTALFPGLDLKFRALKETDILPNIAIGFQSAIGHKRTAGEYVAFSKRYHSLDFTAGLGWGRFGTAGHIANPLGVLSNHFDSERELDGDDPNTPDDWFTGERAGFFGGVEYYPPVEGLVLKADIGADRYEAERAAFGFDAPSPWSIGGIYQFADGADVSLAANGFDRILARYSFKTNVKNLNLKPRRKTSKDRDDFWSKATRWLDEAVFGGGRYDKKFWGTAPQGGLIHAGLDVDATTNAPDQIGRAAQNAVLNNSDQAAEIIIHPRVYNLKGPNIRLIHSDLENALVKNHGSADEIWRNAEFDKTPQTPPLKRSFFDFKAPHFILEQQVSLSEEDEGVLSRLSGLAGVQLSAFRGLVTNTARLRFNLNDNLGQITEFRPVSDSPVRSNISEFTEEFVSIEQLYSNITHSITPEIHLAANAGYLEEQFAGAGAEILYRPFGARWAVGVEGWHAIPRDPDSTLNLGLEQDRDVFTGHVNAWYDIPRWDTTLSVKIGRFLNEDTGFTLGLDKRFRNGVSMNAFTTITNQSDIDVFGGETSNFTGLSVNIPIGRFSLVPPNTSFEFKAEPFGRDSGQAIRNPTPLYDLTTPLSYNHLAQHWSDVVPKERKNF